jgi:hypothetical protein
MTPGLNQDRVHATPEAAIAEVLDTLERAREFLLDPNPQNIDCCRVTMAQCAERMAEVAHDPNLASLTEERLMASMKPVQDELRRISALLGSAAAFHRDVLQVMRGASPAPVIPMDAHVEKVRRVHVFG